MSREKLIPGSESPVQFPLVKRFQDFNIWSSPWPGFVKYAGVVSQTRIDLKRLFRRILRSGELARLEISEPVTVLVVIPWMIVSEALVKK